MVKDTRPWKLCKRFSWWWRICRNLIRGVHSGTQFIRDIPVSPTLLLLDIDPKSPFQSQHRRQVLVELSGEGFCQNIPDIAPRFYVFQSNPLVFNLIPYHVILRIYVLCLIMVFWIFGQNKGSGVVAFDRDRQLIIPSNIQHQFGQPKSFLGSAS